MKTSTEGRKQMRNETNYVIETKHARLQTFTECEIKAPKCSNRIRYRRSRTTVLLANLFIDESAIKKKFTWNMFTIDNGSLRTGHVQKLSHLRDSPNFSLTSGSLKLFEKSFNKKSLFCFCESTLSAVSENFLRKIQNKISGWKLITSRNTFEVYFQ